MSVYVGSVSIIFLTGWCVYFCPFLVKDQSLVHSINQIRGFWTKVEQCYTILSLSGEIPKCETNHFILCYDLRTFVAYSLVGVARSSLTGRAGLVGTSDP